MPFQGLPDAVLSVVGVIESEFGGCIARVLGAIEKLGSRGHFPVGWG